MKSVYAQLGMVLGAAAAAIPDTKTLFSTQLVTITSCGPSVTNCPAASTVTSTIVHSSAAPYQCNPAHSYPNGQKCDATARTLIYPSTTGAPAATTSAYKCNPAHSYPNGQKCDGTALTLIYPSTTAAPVASSSAYRCNPAHSYPNGQSCDGSALTLVYPSTTAAPAASSSAYKCNPAHSYPNGQKCDATALTLIYPSTTAAPAASSSVYQCNPAHSYPNGQKCDATARTLIYPASSAPAASTPAASKASAVTGKVCQTTLSGAYETPHLIVPVDSKNPDKAYGTQYNAYLSADNSTVFNFDIPYSYQGKQCTVLFLFPEQKDLVTSSFTQSGAGGLTFSSLVSPVDQQTTFKNQPAVKSELNHFDGVKPGNSYVVSTGACAAGTKQAIKVSSTGGYSLQYFQDWNPSPIGLFMTSC